MAKCPKCGTRLSAKKSSCKVCEKEFYGVRGAVYCSKACKQKAYRLSKPPKLLKGKHDA